MDGVRGWEGGSVLGTIGLGPRPHALGFAKNVSVGSGKHWFLLLKTRFCARGRPPWTPLEINISCFYVETFLVKIPKVFRTLFFRSDCDHGPRPRGTGASALGLENWAEWYEPWAPDLVMARPGLGQAEA